MKLPSQESSLRTLNKFQLKLLVFSSEIKKTCGFAEGQIRFWRFFKKKYSNLIFNTEKGKINYEFTKK